MDTFSFLTELNNYLDFKHAGLGKISGESSGIHLDIFFSDYDRLTVRTSVRLFGDLPFKDHVESAFQNLSAFQSYSLNEDVIELLSDELTNVDYAFNVSQDIISFSKTLADLGYKSSVSSPDAKAVTDGAVQTLLGMQGFTSVQKDENLMRALPPRVGLGILGAVIGAAVSMGIWILISLMLNYVWPFAFGAILVVIAPLLCYELFSRQKTSAVQIMVCLFLTVVALLLGERLIWAFNLLDWYYNIDFSTAYWEVPYLVEDEIVEAFDYYRDYLIMAVPLVIFYFMIIRNYFTGGMTVMEMMSKRKR